MQISQVIPNFIRKPIHNTQCLNDVHENISLERRSRKNTRPWLCCFEQCCWQYVFVTKLRSSFPDENIDSTLMILNVCRHEASVQAKSSEFKTQHIHKHGAVLEYGILRPRDNGSRYDSIANCATCVPTERANRYIQTSPVINKWMQRWVKLCRPISCW